MEERLLTILPQMEFVPDFDITKDNTSFIRGSIIVTSLNTMGVPIVSLSINKNDIQKIASYLELVAKKDKYYTFAIDNLLKKNEYLQLTIQFKEDLIDENEFNEELENNEDKYLIKMNTEFTESDFAIMSSIIQKLNRNFTSDEISELFSIPFDKSNKFIQSYNNQIQKHING